VAVLLRILAFVPMLVAARLRRIEQRIVTRATEAEATAVERAVLLTPSGQLGEFVRGRLLRNGVLLEAGNDRYYFSPAAYDAFRARRRKRALWIIVVWLIGIAILILRGDV
jgi:hypothetical protein